MGQACVRKGVEVKLMNGQDFTSIKEIGGAPDDIKFQDPLGIQNTFNRTGTKLLKTRTGKGISKKTFKSKANGDLIVEDIDEVDSKAEDSQMERLQQIEDLKSRKKKPSMRKIRMVQNDSQNISNANNSSAFSLVDTAQGLSEIGINPPNKIRRIKRIIKKSKNQISVSLAKTQNTIGMSLITANDSNLVDSNNQGSTMAYTDGNTLKNTSAFNSDFKSADTHNQQQLQLDPIKEENSISRQPTQNPHSRSKSNVIYSPSVATASTKKVRTIVKKLKGGKDSQMGKNDAAEKKKEETDQIVHSDSNQRQITNLIQEQYLESEDSNETKINYCKGELVGSGAYGKVYQGLDTSNGLLLAIKTIQFSMNKEQLKKEVSSIKHEIKMLKNLNHPNIVKYFYSDISEDGKGVDIILEFVPGGSIRQLLDKYLAFDERLVKIYTRQMLEGLKYLHEKGIIHRDLKCANVLVDNMGVIKLSDFGASKKIIQNFDESDFASEQLSKSVIGSPYWMAPEVINKIGHGKPADIWGLGCCVIEMLTSKPPWSEFGKDSKQIMKIIATSGVPPKYPEKMSTECQQFLNYCFEQDQTKRATAEELLYHPFVLMKNQKALQESIEAAKLMSSHMSMKSSIYGSNIYNNRDFLQQNPNQPPAQYTASISNNPYQNFVNSVNSINSIQVEMNSQLNLANFLQNNQQMHNQMKSLNGSAILYPPQAQQIVYRSNTLEPPPNLYGNAGGSSINSINSIILGGLEPGSINMASMMQGSFIQKSNTTGSGQAKQLSFADKLKIAYDKQRQERQEVIIQNWVKNNQSQQQQQQQQQQNQTRQSQQSQQQAQQSQQQTNQSNNTLMAPKQSALNPKKP